MKVKIVKKLNINEARSGDREAGVVVKSIIDFLALMIKAQHKEIISRKDQVPDGDPGGELTAENFGPSFYSEKNFNNLKDYMKKFDNKEEWIDKIRSVILK